MRYCAQPALLIAQVREMGTIEELLTTCSAHVNHLYHIHLAACWISLGQLARAEAKQH